VHRFLSSPFFRWKFFGGLVLTVPLWAIYAPIPESELSKDLILSAKTSVAHDSNLFGAASAGVGSVIFSVAPRITYSGSVTDQAFLATSYGLTLDKFASRPGEKLLSIHEAMMRLAYGFSKSTVLDVTEMFMASRNPESLLAGVPLSPDQSFLRNQIDGRFDTPVSGKVLAALKARSIYFKYKNGALGRSIDRVENILAVAGEYAILPELKAVGEYRHQEVYYRKEGETKNKVSELLMGGFEYALARKFSLSSRVGIEFRKRSAERSATAPFAELAGKYDYTEKSFLTAGLGYNLEETSDTARFTDTQSKKVFVALQHSMTALISASVSVSYEPAVLQGRRGVKSLNEQALRAGSALSYLPSKNWTVSGSLDFDRSRSDDPTRNMDRRRLGLSGNYSF